MRRIASVLVVLLLGLLISGCGAGDTGASGQGANVQATIDAAVQATGAAQGGAAATSAPVPTDAAATTDASTPEAVTTPEAAAATPATAATDAPTPCPVAEGGANDCEAIYQGLLAKYGQDYSTCATGPVGAGSCQKPESLGSNELNEQVNIELILDSSGSMAEDAGGRPKLDIAKEVLGGFVDTLPKQANVGLRVYGHVGSNSEADKALSCGKSELLSPFQTLNAAAFKSTINALQPRGWTPIAGSLQQAQQDFAAYGDAAKNSNLIYLVSDGIETCDGDPIAAARALKEANIQAIVNVVGFAVDAAAAQQLRAAAEAGGGQYYEARNAAELQEIFKQRFDWAAWTGYYNCRVAAATGQFNQDVAQQTAAYNCATAKATTEYNAMNAALTSSYNSKAVAQICYRYATEKITARYRSITNAASSSFRDVTNAADQEYRDALNSASQDYRQTPTP